MKAEREPGRLPFRAGAMVLFALFVLFLFLGLLSLGGGDKKDGLEEAEASKSVATSTVKSSTTEKPSVDTSDVPKLCVLNNGTTTGLAKQVGDELKAAGFTLGSEPDNLSSGSVSENTIFYDEGDEAAAKKVADALGSADIQARPAAFTRCPGEMVVVVVDR